VPARTAAISTVRQGAGVAPASEVSASVGVIEKPIANYPKVEARNYIDEFVLAKLRKFNIVPSDLAGDSEFPLIADVTAPFVYARIMGTSESEKTGYPGKALDKWAKRAQAWASGGAPDDLETITPVKKSEPREVFLYVISGGKLRNPAAAMALIERLK